MDNEKLNKNMIDEKELENVDGGMPAALVFRPGVDIVNQDNLVFDPDENLAALDNLLEHDRDKVIARRRNPGKFARKKNTNFI